MGLYLKYILTSCILVTFISCNLDEQNSVPNAPISITANTLKHWRLSTSTLPLHLAIDTSFSTDEIDAISSVKNEWNRSELNYTLLADDLSETSPINSGSLSSYRDGTLGIYKVTKWFSEVGSSALAVTQFFAYPQVDAQGNSYYEIVHADVLVNYQDHHFSTNPDYYSGEYDLKSVVVHELGHLLGLGHVNDWSIDSVMLPSLSLSERRRELYIRDIDDITELYSSSTSATSKIVERLHRDNGEMVRGIIELQSNGKCRHYFLPIKKDL